MRAILYSLERIFAVILRHFYLWRGSLPRLIDLFYWPAVHLVLWGLINRFFTTQGEVALWATGFLLAAVLLWDILYRAQLGIAVAFLEELWSRNLGQLFVTPLRPWEFALGLVAIGVIRSLVGLSVAALLAYWLYRYNLFELGPSLVLFFSQLQVMGWAVGLFIVAVVLRHGLGAEGFAWAFIFILAPLCGIYYPVAILPDPIEPLAWLLPATYVFEGMRQVLLEGRFNWDYFWSATALNLLDLLLAFLLFRRAFEKARERNRLLQCGE